MLIIERGKYIWLALLLLLLASNVALYNTGLSEVLQIEQAPEVVIGSLLDLIVVMPILALLYLRKFSWKAAIGLIAFGCVLSRFIIPSSMLSPYKMVTTAGIAVELCILLIELIIIAIFITYMPKIVQQMKNSTVPRVFAFPQASDDYAKGNPIIRVLASELLVLYYAYASWRKTPKPGITLHQNSSYIAFQVMMIHAIALESLGIHWWLHSKAPILSLVLLILNVYGIIFFIADIRAMKLNPLHHTADGLYISLGLMKRAYIEFDEIEEVITDSEQLQLKKQKNRAEFICRDFEEVFPQILLKMKQPQTVEYLYGMKKHYDYVAIKCDDPRLLLEIIESRRGQ